MSTIDLSVMTLDCPCAKMKRPDEWHRRHDTEPCFDALESRRAAERAKYAARRKREGRPVVRPWVRNTDGDRWVPGSEVVLPEVDPL